MIPDEKMPPKPYPPYEEETMVAAEPVVVYQRTAPATYRGMQSPSPYSKAEMDEAEVEWLHPFTMEELNRWNEEAEEADEADELLSSEEVFAYMESKYPWLCK